LLKLIGFLKKFYNYIQQLYKTEKIIENKAMGKCKRRNMTRPCDTYFMTRETAVNNVFRMIEEASAAKKSKKKTKKTKPGIKEVLSTISLFGLSAEELSEAGVAYENLKALGSVVNN